MGRGKDEGSAGPGGEEEEEGAQEWRDLEGPHGFEGSCEGGGVGGDERWVW